MRELEAQLAAAPDDFSRLRLFEEIANLLIFENPQKAIDYAEKALAIAENLNDLGVIMKIKNILARGYELAGDLEKALDYNEQVLELAQNNQDTAAQAVSLNNIGLIYQKLNSLVLAAEYFYDAMSLNEEIGNSRGVVINLMNIGTTFYYQHNYDKAQQYFNRALHLSEEIDEQSLELRAKRKIALVWYATEQYKKALRIYQDCVKAEKEREHINRLQLATDYNNIALMYENLNDYDRAIENLNRALEIYSEFGDIKSLAAIYINLGSVRSKMGQYSRAVEMVQKGLEIARENGFKYILLNAHHLLYEISEQTGDIPSAFAHYKKYVALNEEISGPDKVRQIAEIEAKFKIKKQKKEIEVLKTFSMT
ncbi:tetratricopeptide repeat protein, partial [bacterium]|nr:tetratricopeptide repeat protein [bacterium]